MITSKRMFKHLRGSPTHSPPLWLIINQLCDLGFGPADENARGFTLGDRVFMRLDQLDPAKVYHILASGFYFIWITFDFSSKPY